MHLRAFLCVGGHPICTSLSSTQCKTISLRNGLNNIYFFHNFIFVHLSAFVMHFIITKTCKTVSLRKGLKKNHFLKNVLLCIWVQSLCTILSPTQCKTVLLEGLKNNRFYRKWITNQSIVNFYLLALLKKKEKEKNMLFWRWGTISN